MGHGSRGQFSCYPGRGHSSCPSLQVMEKEWTRAEMPSLSAMVVASSSSGDYEASTSGSVGYIDHTVSRLDTLAGVAIKYGVEVADVRRFNGLTTDLQMFALKTLRIPTPGRHPPSAVLTSPSQSRCENFTPSSRLHRAGSHDFKLPSNGKHKAAAKSQDTPTMDLLRDYYGLPSTSAGVREGLEMATLSSGNETDLDDEVFIPMFRPPNTNDSRGYSSGDFKPNRCGYVRESCNNLLDSCWSVHSSQLTESSRLLKSGKKLVREGDSLSKERPIRRRTRGESGNDDTLDVSERVNFPRRDPAPRPKDSSSSSPYARFGSPAPTTDWQSSSEGSSGIKLIGAAVEGLLSKVMQTASPTVAQEGGKPLSERVPSTGSFSVLEGITSAYRQAKAALD
ncbi:hypothetical protein M758_9G156700 [Ceratodon purpureus]|nr:hypothetical protein M758_9G156700 [Ceratodon purpureus]